MSSFKGKERSTDSNTQHSVMAMGKSQNHAKQGTIGPKGILVQPNTAPSFGKSARQTRRPTIIPNSK